MGFMSQKPEGADNKDTAASSPVPDDGMGFMSQKPKKAGDSDPNFAQTGLQSSAGAPIDGNNPMQNQQRTSDEDSRSIFPQGNTKNVFEIMTSGEIDLNQLFNNKDIVSKEDFFLAFRHFNLSNQEVLEMYSFANIKKDGILAIEEWRAFVQIFVQPFMNCDFNFDHALDQHELKVCVFKHDQWKRIAQGPNLTSTFEGFEMHENQPTTFKEYTLANDLILAADRDLDGKIDLSEQISLRKAVIGWSECADSTMSPRALRCGLSIVSQGRMVEQSEANAVFNFALGLQQKNKQRLSFPIFLLVADLQRIFSGFDIPVDNGQITKQDLRKRMLDQDLPLRLTTTAAEAILELDNTDSIDFATFATATIIHNRWFLQSTGQNVNDNFMSMQQFLVFMHDKMIPKVLRQIVDAIQVNVPIDQVVSAAQQLVLKNQMQNLSSDFGLIGGDSSPTNPDADKAINIKKLGPNWVNLSQEYSDQSFVLSFLQTQVKTSASNKIRIRITNKMFATNALYSKEYLEQLRKRGLALPSKKEFKQRALVQQIADVNQSNKATFANIQRLFRMGMLQSTFTADDEYDRVTKRNILKVMETTKVRTGKDDVVRLQKLVDLVGTRYFNFKQFFSFMNFDSVFKKFLSGEDQQVVSEDLEQGLTQMSFPLIRGLANKSKRGVNSLNKQLQDQSQIFQDTMLSEIDAVTTLNSNNSLQNSLGAMSKVAFEDARSFPKERREFNEIQ